MELADNALKGKIARLPATVRDEVSRRLNDGQPGSVILPWLNALPAVQAVLAASFDGVPVSDENLSVWRRTGFVEWKRRAERIERTRELSRYAAEVSRANGASIADGAASIAAGKLLELLEVIDEASILDEPGEDEKGKKTPAEILVAVAGALGSLRTTEQNEVRLKQNDRRLKQGDAKLALEREKFQRDTAGIALKILGDDRAKAIESGTGSMAEKIEALGQLMFPDTWKPATPAK